MASPVYAMLPLILVAFLFFQVSDCSRPLPPQEEQRRPRVPTAPPTAQRDEPLYYHPDTAETGTVETEDDDGSRAARANDGGGAAPSSSLATASPRDKDQGGVVGSRHHNNRSALLRPPVLQRSKLARRFLAGVVEGADSAARASCRSSDVHISCTPPSEH